MESNIRRGIIIFLEISGMILFYSLLNTGGIIKYLIVCVTGLFMFLICYSEIYIIYDIGYYLIPIIVYCSLGLFLSLITEMYSIWTLKTFVFLILPPIFCLLFLMIYAGKWRHAVDIHFIGCTVSYIWNAYNMILKRGVFESTYAYPLGVFALYYAYQKNWGKMIFAMILMMFANKRIANFAVVFCMILMLILYLLKYKTKWIKYLWASLIVTVEVYLYIIYSGIFNQLCNLINLNITNRIDVYNKIFKELPKYYFWGNGLGSANVLLEQILKPELFQRWFQNPHNDFLKLLVELGSIGLVVFLVSYFLVFRIAEKRLPPRAFSQLFITIVYFMILMLTDNVSIYILFLIPMYLISFTIMGEKES